MCLTILCVFSDSSWYNIVIHIMVQNRSVSCELCFIIGSTSRLRRIGASKTHIAG